jgi:uncharacterized protein
MNTILNNEKQARNAFYVFLLIMVLLVGGGLSKSMAQAPASEYQGIFYEITGNGLQKPSYLLGTYHLLNSGYLQQFPAIMKAQAETGGSVVEVVIDSAEMMQTQAMGMMPGKKLSDMLEKPFADSLSEALQKTIGAPLAAFDQLKPMNVMIALSVVQNMRDNDSLLKAYSGVPMDKAVADVAKSSGKNLTALETLEEQMNLLFNHDPIDEQVKQLKVFLRRNEEGRKLSNEMVKAYLSHDLPAMESFASKAMEITGQADYLVKDRNDRWMKTIPGLIQKQSQFIAVGALHLAGDSGLVAQLRALGFNVSAVNL